MKKTFLTLGLLVFILGIAQTSLSQTIQQNKQIVSRYFDEVINHQNIALVPELYADEFTYHDLHDFTETKSTAKSFQETLAGFFKAFPDAHYTVDNLLAEGDKVFAQITLTATHKGDFMGLPASNKSLKITEMYVMTIQKGKIIAGSRLIDFQRFFEQLAGK